MLRNEQAIEAFHEILKHIEAEAVRADAIFEVMLERGQIHPQELQDVMDNAKTRQRVKWDAIRTKIRSILENKTRKAIDKAA